jgi:hypothetical protein
VAEQPEGDGQVAAPTNAADAASDRLLTQLDSAFWLLLIVYGVSGPFLLLLGSVRLVDLHSTASHAPMSLLFLAFVVTNGFLAVRGLQLAWAAPRASGVRLARRTSHPRAYVLAWAWCGTWTALIMLLGATAIWFTDAITSQLGALLDPVGSGAAFILVLALGLSPLLAWGPLVAHWISQRGRKRREYVMPA